MGSHLQMICALGTNSMTPSPIRGVRAVRRVCRRAILGSGQPNEGPDVEERKLKVEIRIGRDDDGAWWAVLLVDDDEALWRGPYKRQAGAEKAGFDLAANIEHLDADAIRCIAEKGLPTRH